MHNFSGEIPSNVHFNKKIGKFNDPCHREKFFLFGSVSSNLHWFPDFFVEKSPTSGHEAVCHVAGGGCKPPAKVDGLLVVGKLGLFS